MNRSPMIVFAAVVAAIPSLVSLADDKPTQILAGWGAVTDPDNDCNVRGTPKKLTITIPGTNHNLHPARGVNAPRVLQKISGDFTVQVKVSSEFKPGTSSTVNGRPFNGAGILIWQDGDNFLRVERNAFWIDDSLVCYPPLMEYWRNREYAGANEAPEPATYFRGESTWLKADRKGKNVTVSISHDGKDWIEVKSFEADMLDDLQVGVSAVNSSDTPFTVNFEELTIKGAKSK